MPNNTAASIRQRLLNLTRERHEDFDYVLRQYVLFKSHDMSSKYTTR